MYWNKPPRFNLLVNNKPKFGQGCSGSCDNYNFEFALFNETVTSEFDLVCDKQSYPAFISSITFVGLFFGALSTGFCSDKFGRKKVIAFTTFFTLGSVQPRNFMYFLLKLTLKTVFAFMTSVASKNAQLYTIFRMLTGALVHGCGCVAVTWLMEFVAIKYRSWVTAFAYVMFDLGIGKVPKCSSIIWHRETLFRLQILIMFFLTK